MLIGKLIRTERIFNRDTGRTIIVPLDHGVSVGPIAGIENMRDTVTTMVEGGANAVLMHKGVVPCGHRAKGRDIGLIVHLSASTSLSPFPNAKTLVCSVEEAIRLGADAVSTHINLGDETESRMLEDLGRITQSSASWGIPMLAMIYARGPKIQNEFDPTVVAHCARVGMELGADVVKVPYTGDKDSFAAVCRGCAVPVVIAGGPKTKTTREFLTMIRHSLDAGGRGLSVGRNIFQDKNPRKLLQAVNRLVHDDASIDEAMALIES
ncbi:class I fructose-bisphosphate aldolase family protein [Desulfovibrio sulfodismutans]|uniref:2-amino-3,7-dideoxy-D-threo-hept-6-ulosonate synthase n=1 Tax=Desulfolutivibrio sulfodismutans TaxID=63561 RepID=A0A7K3NP18_9BACT|nr:2-amino-3,7-dideoxy-D-threo-hept-6-ulosonate synthase [Desulfolutivibrio sulfodismutans]NDY57583.1 class I fructose-bisphosphate aldolase family protein [Desulfolutivibrio sulfodismutans]QLA11107.1 fructose-bisphosphate aldolase [Desulfolutivibrio sulfodismutans DSM 3696]